MTELVYSPGATNVLHRFHGTETMLFVEGKDDVPFWEYLAKRFGQVSVKVEDVGGKQIEKYIDRLARGELKGIVAADSDYSWFSESVKHPNLLRTAGHSIENSLVCEEVLVEVIWATAQASRREIDPSDINDWLDRFCTAFKQLIYLDIANHINGAGETVLGTNCARFMTSNRSPEASAAKIEDFIDGLDLVVDSSLSSEICSRFRQEGLVLNDIIRGHFLFSGALRLACSIVEKIRSRRSLSMNSFLGLCLISFEKSFGPSHRHFSHYKSLFEMVEI